MPYNAIYYDDEVRARKGYADLEDTFAVSLDKKVISTEDIASWMSSEKENDSHQPVCRGEEGLFSFQMRGFSGFLSWSGCSEVERNMSVEVEKDDYMFFWESGSTYGVNVGNKPLHANHKQGILTTADRYTKIAIGKNSAGEGFCIARNLVTKALSEAFECPVPGDFEFEPTHSMTTGIMPHILRMARYFNEELCGDASVKVPEITFSHFRETICHLMVLNLRHSLSDRLRPARRVAPKQIKMAKEFAYSYARTPITVADMAAVAGVSVRSLQLNFRNFMDISPAAFLRQIRMEGARRDILACGSQASIRDIARNWGFANSGRFASEYRSAFGVLPSEDIQKMRHFR